MHSAQAMLLRLLWLLLLAAVLALPFDAAVSQWFHAHPRNGILPQFLRFPDMLGQYAIHLLILPVLLALPNRKKLLQGYLMAYLLGFAVEIIKYLVGRARPLTGFGTFHFEPLTFGHSMNSFPSGDASAALILAALLCLYFPRSRWCFIALGLWCGLGRVALNRHYLSDVLTGSALGIGAVLLTYRLLGPSVFTLFFVAPDERAPRATVPVTPQPQAAASDLPLAELRA